MRTCQFERRVCNYIEVLHRVLNPDAHVSEVEKKKKKKTENP